MDSRQSIRFGHIKVTDERCKHGNIIVRNEKNGISIGCIRGTKLS